MTEKEFLAWLDLSLSKNDYNYRGVLRRDPCAYCGRKFTANRGVDGPSQRRTGRYYQTVDHIAPRNRNQPHKLRAPNSWENLTGCCSICNADKGNRQLIFHLLRIQKRGIRT